MHQVSSMLTWLRINTVYGWLADFFSFFFSFCINWLIIDRKTEKSEVFLNTVWVVKLKLLLDEFWVEHLDRLRYFFFILNAKCKYSMSSFGFITAPTVLLFQQTSFIRVGNTPVSNYSLTKLVDSYSKNRLSRLIRSIVDIYSLI